MKINKLILGVFILFFSLIVSNAVFAEDDNEIKETSITIKQDANKVEIEDQEKSDDSMKSIEKRQDDKEKVESSKDDDKDDDKNKSDDDSDDSKSDVGEAHRSAVANFVQGLLKVGNKYNGIGDEVKAIAKAQDDTVKITTDAITKIEKRNKIKTFFFGSDYKNLGALRSSMTTTANQIDQLKKVIEKVTNLSDKAAFEKQLKVLEDEQVKINEFITKNENKFSLFGWLFK